MNPGEKNKLFPVAQYHDEINQILNVNLPCTDVYQSVGLEIHMQKRNHENCIPYLPKLSEIIETPDFVGVNPKEGNSVELVKIYDINVLVAVKLDVAHDYLYVASVYSISKSKLERRINSGRLRKFTKKVDIESA